MTSTPYWAYSLMALVLVAPHLKPRQATVLGLLFLALALVTFAKGVFGHA